MRGNRHGHLENNRKQREQSALLDIIPHLLRQEQELQWLLATPLPTPSSWKVSVDQEVYRQQVLAAMSAGYNQRKRREVRRRLTVLPAGCIDGLDTCFADEAVNQEIWLLILRALDAIYRFYASSAMELDEEIPGLPVGNTTLEVRQVIAGRVREALSESKDGSRGPVFRRTGVNAPCREGLASAVGMAQAVEPPVQ